MYERIGSIITNQTNKKFKKDDEDPFKPCTHPSIHPSVIQRANV